MLEFLPQTVKDGLAKINTTYLYEIRMRADRPIMVNYQGRYRYLATYGLTERSENALISSAEEIADCVFRAGEFSVYAVEEELKQGFLTAKGGVRIGISGEYVCEKGQPLSLRNYTSLCIRVPHEVKGCALEIYQRCMSDTVKNLLLMSSPGLGKTTILRDLTRILSEKQKKNILICDERGEICVGEYGNTCDVIRFCDKERAFTAGIRAMRPEIIVTDELSLADCAALKKAVAAGICVIASAHYSNFCFVERSFKELFERYILLDEEEIGRIKGIYDSEGKEIW